MTSVLAISGSLRAASLDTALLRAAREHSPADVTVTLCTGLADVPHYNEDLDNDRDLHDPTTVELLRTTLAALRDQIAARRAPAT